MKCWNCCCWILALTNVSAFLVQNNAVRRGTFRLLLSQAKEETEEDASYENMKNNRRRFFQATVAAIVSSSSLLSPPETAHATYSAYSRREDDWKQRQEEGAVQFSSATSLRSQLREIAPQNTSGRQLFCPNGPTANVSPLMENKCGDRQALPSVYGRTEDTLGNSIPGFAGGFYSSGISTSMSNSADTGGLPSYSALTGK